MRKRYGAVVFAGVFLLSSWACAATFPGNAYLKTDDPSKGLSDTDSSFSISCWFKISIPSGTILTENMVILVDRQDGGTGDDLSYLLHYNYQNAEVEFYAKGASGSLDFQSILEHPYLDRWYH